MAVAVCGLLLAVWSAAAAAAQVAERRVAFYCQRQALARPRNCKLVWAAREVLPSPLMTPLEMTAALAAIAGLEKDLPARPWRVVAWPVKAAKRGPLAVALHRPLSFRARLAVRPIRREGLATNLALVN